VLLPKTKAELVEIQSSVKRKKDLAMYLAQHALSPHTPDWIRSHGMCMEYRVPRTSNVYFGDLVTTNPLLALRPLFPLLQTHDQEKWHALVNWRRI
jgi:hypothetical protein